MDQLEKILVLLLGCVVQCDNKVPLIEQMKKMDLNQQGALVMYIKQVTDSTEYVCSIDWNDLQDISKQYVSLSLSLSLSPLSSLSPLFSLSSFLSLTCLLTSMTIFISSH